MQLGNIFDLAKQQGVNVQKPSFVMSPFFKDIMVAKDGGNTNTQIADNLNNNPYRFTSGDIEGLISLSETMNNLSNGNVSSQLKMVMQTLGVNVSGFKISPFFSALLNAKSGGATTSQIADYLSGNPYRFNESDIESLVGLGSVMNGVTTGSLPPQFREIAKMLGLNL